MKGQISAPANPIYQVGLMIGEIWEEEVRLMDMLPRHEAYVSMLALGLCAGFVIAVLLNMLVPVILSLLPYALTILGAVILLILIMVFFPLK